jgi:hypothetical protein
VGGSLWPGRWAAADVKLALRLCQTCWRCCRHAGTSAVSLKPVYLSGSEELHKQTIPIPLPTPGQWDVRFRCSSSRPQSWPHSEEGVACPYIRTVYGAVLLIICSVWPYLRLDRTLAGFTVLVLVLQFERRCQTILQDWPAPNSPARQGARFQTISMADHLGAWHMVFHIHAGWAIMYLLPLLPEFSPSPCPLLH